MKILGIETATAVCGAAVVVDGVPRVERSIEAPHVHSEKLMTLIDECLQISGIDLRDCDGIAVSIGPGSFTGLRIGLSVAKGLAYAAGKPVISVPTLEALAWRAIHQHLTHEGDLILPMIDARRDEVYTATYRHSDAKLEEVTSARAIALKEITNSIGLANRVIVLGDGVEKFQHFLMKTESVTRSKIIAPPREARTCSALSVALRGEAKLVRGQRDDLSGLEPLYVKDFFTLVKTQHQLVTL